MHLNLPLRRSWIINDVHSFCAITNIRTEAHVPTSRYWPIPYACPQSYHPGSGGHMSTLIGAPYWGSSEWHSRRVSELANQCVKFTADVCTSLNANFTVHKLLVGNRKTVWTHNVLSKVSSVQQTETFCNTIQVLNILPAVRYNNTVSMSLLPETEWARISPFVR